MHIVVVPVLSDVDAVEQNLSFLRVIQSAEQLDEGRFAGTVLSDHCHALSNPKAQADVMQRPLLRAGVAEGNIAKLHLIFAVGAFFGGQGALVHRIGNIQQLIDRL